MFSEINQKMSRSPVLVQSKMLLPRVNFILSEIKQFVSLTQDCCDEKDFLNALEIKIIPAYFELNNTQFPTLKLITTLAHALSSNFVNVEEKYEKLKLRLSKIYD